jgi:hypothetical protein
MMGLMGASTLHAKGGVKSIPSIGTEVMSPMADVAMDFEGVTSSPHEEGPESTLDPDLYRGLKERAEHDPKAEIPDVLVPLAPELLNATMVNRSYPGLDQATAITNGELWPPDTTLGKSGSQVVTAVNSAIRLLTPVGSTVATKSLNSFFNADPVLEAMLFDPRVLYDRLGPQARYFVVALQRNDSTKTSSVYLAVSRVSNPTDLEPANWCRYKINAVRPSGDADPETWADFPMIGVGSDAFLISNDQFSFKNSKGRYVYKYAMLRVVNKAAITNNSTSCPQYSAAIFLPEKVLPGTTQVSQAYGHVQPAIHYTAPSSFGGVSNPVYMFSTIAPSSMYRLWRVANAASGAVLLDQRDLTVGTSYSMPAKAVQLGGIPLDTKDNRITQVVGIGDTLWAVHATNCVVQSGSVTYNKACIRFLQLYVSGPSLDGLVQQDVTFASPSTELDLAYFMPGLAVNSLNQSGIVFLTSSSSRFLSAAWTIKYLGDAIFAPATLFATGDCSKGTEKVGDYVGAQVNPNDLVSFWFAGESAWWLSSTSSCLWKTQITQVTP